MKNLENQRLERNSKIISLYEQKYSYREISETLIAQGYKASWDTVSDVIKEYRETRPLREEYDDKKIASTEKSLIRQRDESNYLRRVNREIFREEIKKDSIEELVERVVKSFIKPIKPYKIESKVIDWKIELFHFTDIHIGKKGTIKLQEDEKLTIKQRLDLLFKDILNSKADTIYLINTGDLFENLIQEGMHSGQLLSMDILYANEIILYTFEVFCGLYEELIKKKKKVKSKFIGWNHDRTSKKNEDDLIRMGMFMFVEMLKQRFKDIPNFEFEYTTKTRLHSLDENFNLLISHWESGFNNTKVEQIRTKYGILNEKHLLVLSWHRHNVSISNGYNTTKVIWPSLAWIWDYDYNLGFSSNNGYIKVTLINELPSIQIVYTD